MPFYTLAYLAFLFMPLFLRWIGGGAEQWAGPVRPMLGATLLSILVFLPLYFASYRFDGPRAVACMLAIAALGHLLLPVNAFANCYTVYASGLAATIGGPLWRRVAWMALIATALLLEILWLRYPVFIFLVTIIMMVGVFFGNHQFIENTRKRAELKLSHDEVRRLAAFAERERIGRDLHDLLGHTLSMIALKSELAGRLLQHGDDEAARARARAEIVEVAEVARATLSQVRTAVSGIRAAGIAAELAAAKLLLEYEGVELISRLGSDGGSGDPEAVALSPEIETALALTLREAVINIQRHACAARADVALEIRDCLAVLRISDDGRGGAIVPGNGLAGMRERIEALGGSLRIESAQGRGTQVEARVAVRVESAARQTESAV
ncbi:MAG: sensor histidine kinase [Lysobacteraceae bacterium]|nr:MAG: sensor histidine kinase [Xanthomonadaceae bacterium]